MTRLNHIVLFVVTMGCWLLTQLNIGQAQATNPLVVRGRVVQASSDRSPIRGLRVVLEGSESRPVAFSVTDGSGTYYLSRVEPGSYILTLYFGNTTLGKYPIEVPSDPRRYTPGVHGATDLYYDLPLIEMTADLLRSSS
jgi:hypothetical protein